MSYNDRKYRVTTIGGWAFFGESELTSVSIPQTVTRIAEQAFSNCSKLKSISLPEGVTTIERAAFSRCGSLTGISIPEGVTTISTEAFAECSQLSHISLPGSLKYIETGAFTGCSSLKTVSIKAAEPFDLYNNTFEVYGDLYVPQGCKASYQNAPIWEKFNIIEMSAAGIATTITQSSEPVIYNLSGKRLRTPQKGINIVKVGKGRFPLKVFWGK